MIYLFRDKKSFGIQAKLFLRGKDVSYNMEKRILSGGGILLIVGLFLTLAFWPLFGISGSEIAEDREGLQFESYDEGDKVLVYGTITSIGETPDWLEDLGVFIQIDNEINLILTDIDSTDFEVGDEVYGRLTLKDFAGIEYWEIEGDLSSKQTVDHLFYGIAASGAFIGAFGAIKD